MRGCGAQSRKRSSREEEDGNDDEEMALIPPQGGGAADEPVVTHAELRRQRWAQITRRMVQFKTLVSEDDDSEDFETEALNYTLKLMNQVMVVDSTKKLLFKLCILLDSTMMPFAKESRPLSDRYR